MTKSAVRVKVGITTLIAGTVTFHASTLHAQEEEEFLKFSVDTKIEYTDNRDSVASNEESNTDVLVSPRIDAYISTDRTLTDFYYQPSFRYRSDAADSQNDDELFHRVGLFLNHNLTESVKLRLSEEYILTDDPSIEQGGTTIRDDQTYYVNKLGGGVKVNLNRRTHVDVNADQEIKRFDEDEVASKSDEDRTRSSLRAVHSVNKTLAVSGELRYESYEFSSDSGIKRDFDVLVAAAGAAKVFSPELRGSAYAGVTTTSYDDSSLDDDSGPYLDLDLTASPSPAFRVKGGLTHGVRESDVFPFASQTYTELRGRAELEATPAVDVGLSGTFRVSEYDDSNRPLAPFSAFAQQVREGDEDTAVITAYAEWKFSNQSKLRLAQVYEDVSSDVETSFTRNTSSAEVHVEF